MAAKGSSTRKPVTKPMAGKRAKPVPRPDPVAAETPSAADSNITVRMFCPGLGDCFLITIPQDAKRPYSILIDCGVAKGTSGDTDLMKTVVKKIAALTQDEDNRSVIDLLVVTHQHWDHVSGFLQAFDELNKITFNNVWQAWTEDSQRRLGTSVDGEIQKVKKAVARAFHLAPKVDASGEKTSLHLGLDGLLSFLGPTAIEDASEEEEIKRGIAGAMLKAASLVKDKDHRSYLRPGQYLALPGASGEAKRINVFTLGPPHDQDKLVRINPSKRAPETYDKQTAATELIARLIGESVELPPEPVRQPGVALGLNWAWMAAAMSRNVGVAELEGDEDDKANVTAGLPFDENMDMTGIARRTSSSSKTIISTRQTAVTTAELTMTGFSVAHRSWPCRWTAIPITPVWCWHSNCRNRTRCCSSPRTRR